MSAKSIMIQGTMSNAGKSFITAGLLRVFMQDGYKVAPFKSQNMALNSYITEEGLEIGRAQAMQAQACGIEPSVDMNPILLKPTSNTGSQIIVHGEVVGNKNAMDYYKEKKQWIPTILESYKKLEDIYDIIVIEGAGSPAEINLRDDDIVNMGLARMVKAPVLLAGDIDRGGLFAALYGTVKLLEIEEQKYIKGLIVNKFRGDINILKPGLRMIEEKLGIPVLGTIPMTQIDIDDEDSLSERLNKTLVTAVIDIVVIKLPHISNFTDFNVFERIEGVSLRYVSSAYNLGHPDLIILPGTKNTMDDLIWMRESGLETLILREVQRDTYILGICGGFQMLGRDICDPHSVEHGGSMRGLGLLDAETIFAAEKTRSRVRGKIIKKPKLMSYYQNEFVKGYEIHMGQTKNLGQCIEVIELEDGRADALIDKSGHVLGTYLHGILDNEGMTLAISRYLAEKKGVELKADKIDEVSYNNGQYDKLANLIRESLDMDKIYKIVEDADVR